MKPAILLPDGVGLRNFLLGPFLEVLSKQYQSLVFHPIRPESVAIYATELGENIQWFQMHSYREHPLGSFFRNAASYAHLFHYDNQGMRYVRDLPVNGSFKMRLGRKLAKILGRIASNRAGIMGLERVQLSFASRAKEIEHYRALYQEFRPTVLFCSHHRPTEAVPAVLAARQLGIPTAVFIFSWDNLSSKTRVVAPYDHYFVWSQLMKDEMATYYPEIPGDRVHIVGTPQFDPYYDPRNVMPREEFFRWLGADSSRPLICFSGSDISTAPDDQFYVEILMEEIRAGKVNGNPQVVLRPAPVDSGKRFERVRKLYPELIYKAPNWVSAGGGDWKQLYPLPDDVKTLANLTLHSDINLNVSSTMTLDFALRDKPVVNIAFDVTQPPPFGVPIWDFHFKFEHYVPVVRLGAARFAKTRAELVEHINAYLTDPSLDRSARRQFVDLEIGVPMGQASKRIIDVLNRISA